MADIDFPAEWVEALAREVHRQESAWSGSIFDLTDRGAEEQWRLLGNALREECRSSARASLAALLATDALVTPPGHRAVEADLPPCGYVSTACRHGLHDRCRLGCKFCGEACGCPRHGDPEAARVATVPTMSAPRTYYFASRYSRNPELRGYRDELESKLPGARVTSRWIDLHGGALEQSFTPAALNTDPDACWPLGAHDLQDIDAAATVVSFTGTGGKGGRHVEFGYGLAAGKRLVVVGDREHIFHTAPVVEWYPDWPAFLATELARESTP